MEPCISLDGRLLFFNNSNESGVKTKIHFAVRTGANTFQHMGILSGTESDNKDMAPSIDEKGDLFFTSLRSFESDHHSLYVGHLEHLKLVNLVFVAGDITTEKAFWINMDSAISPDGNTLVVARAQFLPGGNVPRQSHLIWATREKAGTYKVSGASDTILEKVNSAALEYAPALTADGLELFFTREGMRADSLGSQVKTPHFEILLATRKTPTEPFSQPEHLAAIDGFVEAPSLTLDKRELFYHKKVGAVYQIWKVTRAEH